MTTTATPTIIKGIDVDRLYVDSIDAGTIHFDFDIHTHVDFAEEGTWNYWEHAEPDTGDEAACQECYEEIEYVEEGGRFYWKHTEAPVFDPEIHEPEDFDDGEWGEDAYDHEGQPDSDYTRERCEGPMMNYFYPLEIRDPDAAAKKLAGTCLCVVEVGGEMGLALTGGGMDLTWEICEAYMLLGSLPPAEKVRHLPKMADTMSDKHRLVLAGARRTLTIQKQWAEQALEEIDSVEDYFENQRWRR